MPLTKRLLFILVISIVVVPILVGQSIYLPSSHEAYSFLRRMETRGLLKEYRDAARPLSRRVIASHLHALDSVTGSMTEVERDEYEFLKGEFRYELSSLAGDPEPTEIRWHLFTTDFPGGILNFDFIGRLAQTTVKKDYARLRGQGARFYGYAFNNVGYYFNFVDNREVGKAINVAKLHTPDPGIVLTKQTDDAIEYNTTEAQFTFHIGAFQFSLEKMQNNWGLGRRGQLAFSDKPPAYPQVKMRVPVTNWMDFIYFHAELNSTIIDPNRSYFANSSSLVDFFRPVDRLKYMAAHMVEITPIHGVDVSLGESVVYSDRGPLLIYLIPVMFFKSAEHYNQDKDNVQWFGNLDLNLIPNTNVYFSLFIDELNIDDILDPLKARNQLGVTAGIQTYDMPIKNLEILAEYTRMNPWTYTHKYPAATFTNNGYVLGHWIGQNADDLYLELSYRPMRSLVFGATMERYRKGGLTDIAYQYRLPSQPFLYSPVREERSFGLYGQYQLAREGFLDLRARSKKLSDEALGISDEKKFEWSVGLRYGIW